MNFSKRFKNLKQKMNWVSNNTLGIKIIYIYKNNFLDDYFTK